MASIYDWSTTEANNATADAGINWQEGQLPSTVNNSARYMMRRGKEILNDLGAVATAAGTANAITVTASSPFSAYVKGIRLLFKAASTNTAAATLNVNAIGAKNIVTFEGGTEQVIGAGYIVTGGLFEVIYDTALASGSGAWVLLKPGASAYSTKSSGYTALPGDNGSVVRYTAAATEALTAAASLGPGWRRTVIADGGAVTIDPNGSETINGLATLSVPDGSSATIVCDGSNFFTLIRPSAWVTAPMNPTVVLSGQTSVPWTDLASFRRVRMTLECTVSSAAQIMLRVSTNNGSSYLSGASDYLISSLNQASTTVAGATPAFATGFLLSTVNVDANTQVMWTAELSNFNKAVQGAYKGDGLYVNGGSLRRDFPYGFNGTSARNALQLVCSAGNFATGQVTLEGIRG